ncbi:MAG: hypothetical protein JSS66_02185 [Armatimonadetes bacterium]|nr:hypothetical protein [Armatimonadota bacterium]
MAKANETKPEERLARGYADRLILEKLTEMYEVVKPSELAEKLQGEGLGLAAVRSLLASNPHMFAYEERRWVPAARVESQGRSIHEAIRMVVDRFGGPMPLGLLVGEIARTRAIMTDQAEELIRRTLKTDDDAFLTLDEHVALSTMVYKAYDESIDRAYRLNGVTEEEVAEVEKKLGKFDWTKSDAILMGLEKAAPVSAKAFGAAAWRALNPQDPRAVLLYDWKAFNAELLSIPGFVYASDGTLHPESEAKKWVSAAVKYSDKVVATIEVEDAAPLELKKADLEAVINKILSSESTVTATEILESNFEITPTVKTFPDDLKNVMDGLRADGRAWWVGGDRFRKANSAPDFIYELPAPFEFEQTPFLQDDGDPVDVELTEEGLSSSLRKLITHPLAMDVNDEDILPTPKAMPETVRLVLKPVHRELGTFALPQFPTGWFDNEPDIQEVIFIAADGRELQVWLNNKARLLFGLFDWWLDQPVESGAVFSLTKTHRPNVFEFAWLDQTDPVVYISSQRMEELREIAGRAADMSTFDVVREVMTHWPKGADFLTILWEVNVVRRTSRKMLASLLSSYVCFYQRSGSPVWHYDHKKVEQGFDKTKKKFIVK